MSIIETLDDGSLLVAARGNTNHPPSLRIYSCETGEYESAFVLRGPAVSLEVFGDHVFVGTDIDLKNNLVVLDSKSAAQPQTFELFLRYDILELTKQQDGTIRLGPSDRDEFVTINPDGSFANGSDLKARHTPGN